MNTNVQAVWAEKADGSFVPLYFGRDALAAEKAYNEQHLNGAFEFVGWSSQVVRPYRHTTPAKDGCAVIEAPVEALKAKGKGK